VYVPVGVAAEVLTDSVVTMGGPVVEFGFVPNTAVAPVGSAGVTPRVTVHELVLPPTVTVTFP